MALGLFDWSLLDLFQGIVALLVEAVNGLIAALGSILQALVTALPEMPALPAPPAALVTAESWVAWAFPVGTLLDCLAFTLAMWLLWQAVAIALRWAKATDA